MDSALDIKFKKLMSEYFPNKKEKLNPIYLAHFTRPYFFVKRKKKKQKAHTVLLKEPNLDNQTDSRINKGNLVILKLKSAFKNDNKTADKFKQFDFKPVLLSSKLPNKNPIARLNSRNKKVRLSGILQDQTFTKLRLGQVSINSLMKRKEKNNLKTQNIKKNISESELNRMNNLHLSSSKEEKFPKHMTKFAMLNNLYHKYSSTSSGSINKNNKEDEKIDAYYKKGNNDSLSKENSIYLTSFNKNNFFHFNNIYKRALNLPDNQKTNNQIMNKDNKIFINCLLSKVDAEINACKLFPKNNGKTLYSVQNEDNYLRICNLDNVVSELMKK